MNQRCKGNTPIIKAADSGRRLFSSIFLYFPVFYNNMYFSLITVSLKNIAKNKKRSRVWAQNRSS